MTWWSLIVIATAILGVVAGQIYLRLGLRETRRRRSAEHWVIMCAGTAVLGYGLVAVDCLTSKQCFAPQRIAEGIGLVKTGNGAELVGFVR